MIALGAFFAWELHRVRNLARQQTDDLRLAVKSVLGLKDASLRAYAYDYTIWDDMVAFADQPSVEWAAKYIDSSLRTFNLAAVWVFRGDLSLAHVAVGKNNLELADFPLPSAALPGITAGQTFPHFFVDSPAGLLEICGAPIQPSDDLERGSPAHGYLFAGRLWVPEYLTDIAQGIGAEVKLRHGPEPETGKLPLIPQAVIVAEAVLPGWNAAPLATLVVERKSQALAQFKRTAAQETLFFGLFAVCLLLLQFSFLTREVTRPLEMVSRSLERNDPAVILPLLKRSTEFGAIAKLIRKFFSQQQLLVDEIKEHKKTEQELRQTRFQLSQTERLRSVGKLAASVAEDVKLPLSAVGQGIDQLSRIAPCADAPAAGILRAMREAVQRADWIIQGLHDFSGVSRLAPGLQPINPVVERALAIVKPEATAKHVRIERSLAESLPDLEIDKEKIIEVLVNVFLNGIRSAPTGGTLRVRTQLTRFSKPGGLVGRRQTDFFALDEPVLVVDTEDTGSVIPPEALQPPADSPSESRPAGLGTGLGLAVSQSILAMHRGMLDIGTLETGGTRVRLVFSLPPGGAPKAG